MHRHSSAIYATLWSFIERFSTQIISFLIGIVLARLLSPDDYGVVGLTTIFISISNVFIDSGFANGLIRKIDRTEKDLSTAFIFNIIIGVIAYIILWILSPYIAKYFDEPLLKILIKIVGLNVLFNSFCIVQTAILTAKLDVRGQTFINLLTLLPAGILAICLAYHNYGLYALVYQTICASFLRVVLIWIYTKWKPSARFSYESFKYLWSFGSKLLCANLIGTIFNEIYTILIGKYIGKRDLGFYAKSSSLNAQVDSIFSGIIQKIALPILSKYQFNSIELFVRYREFLCYLVLILSPLIAILFAISEDVIVLLWSEKWKPCVIIFQLLIIGTIFNPLSNLSLSLLQVLGKTHVILKLEFPKKTIYCIFILIGFYYGLIGLVTARVFVNITGAFINIWVTKKYINYSYKSQIIDIFKYIILAFLVTILSMSLINFINPILNILCQMIIIPSLYLILLFFFKDEMLISLYIYVKGIFKMKS